MPVDALSPLDGRYHAETEELARYLSEAALMRQRLRIEVEWLREMAACAALPDVPVLSPEADQLLSEVVQGFDTAQLDRIKALEATTQHDVKAVEYYLRERLDQPSTRHLVPFVHFACTSEDINNLAWALLIRDALAEVLGVRMRRVVEAVAQVAHATRSLPMLTRTHGQPATPSTLGKELAVFVYRWRRQLAQIDGATFLGKFNGAVGTFGAHWAAYPDAPWLTISRHFVERLGLTYNPLTTQIESHDYLAELFHALMRFNTITLDFVRDMWLYISLGYFRQRVLPGAVGSSTMPHKVNPIQFENAEANLGLSNSLLDHLAGKLPISRLQRDLSDSSALRNIGSAFGYLLVAMESTLRGFQRLDADPDQMRHDLDQAWEVLAEAVQTVLRKNGRADAYELMKDLTQGRTVGPDELRQFIARLDLDPADRDRLLALTPSLYTGLADQLVSCLDNE